MPMAREQIKELAHKAAEEGVTLTKEQCAEMSMQDLAQYDFLVEKYKAKLEAIDKTISSAINNYAKTNGYDLVLVKGAVLYGGEDITEAVSKVVK